MNKDKADAVDAIVDQWRRARPDLDPSGKAITGRIVRLAALMQRRFAAAFDELLRPGTPELKILIEPARAT